MPRPDAIAVFLQSRLELSGLQEVTAVDAARWLDEAGVLRDSTSRPGQPLRILLRAGAIPKAEQRSGRWFILRASGRDHERDCAVSPSRAKDGGLADNAFRRAATSGPPPAAERSGAPGRSDGRSIGPFTSEGLATRGFVGFERFAAMLSDRPPVSPGVYVVLREKLSRPAFLSRSPAGWFKGQDPTVAVAELEAAWPEGAHCVYIGKAGPGAAGTRGLRQRIRELRQYGDGRPVGHQGGRRIWQLVS